MKFHGTSEPPFVYVCLNKQTCLSAFLPFICLSSLRFGWDLWELGHFAWMLEPYNVYVDSSKLGYMLLTPVCWAIWGTIFKTFSTFLLHLATTKPEFSINHLLKLEATKVWHFHRWLFCSLLRAWSITYQWVLIQWYLNDLLILLL